MADLATIDGKIMPQPAAEVEREFYALPVLGLLATPCIWLVLDGKGLLRRLQGKRDVINPE